ncbi:MAG: hypothetical protein SF069_10675 [Phycisphaerae bacterium]|nr:hypothetical protein [Phycisphaerae bacterium]
MKGIGLRPWLVSCGIVTITTVFAAAVIGAGEGTTSQAASVAGSQPVVRPQAELEQELTTMLSDAELVGTFRMAEDLAKKSPLSEPMPERYRIVAAEKDVDDWWVITARIQYMQADVTVPLRVRIRWAGDTPIVTVDDLLIPGINKKYSARVMFYRGYYTGTWFGDNYGGVMSGEIRKAAKEG